MSSDRYNRNIENLDKALFKFGEALAEPESSIVRDASIQRFEFTYELLWKTLKNFVEEVHGIRTVSPRQVFKEAFALSLIEKEAVFIEMIESRNTLAHTYSEDQAKSIYEKCPTYLAVMKNVFNQLKNNK
ncbi:MAG: nucleotidyltransferase substrate binding protein [Candidatus Marinimicrobia bacterium]|nr:nucleotidyltransferase substrate binding protein [Candidatus Neomarinimicrobiota bacterium]